VWWLIKSTSAIWLMVNPLAIKSRTSFSRVDSFGKTALVFATNLNYHTTAYLRLGIVKDIHLILNRFSKVHKQLLLYHKKSSYT
jgi:hypothetical protein